MGNSVTRAHVRRNLGLAEALDATLTRCAPYRHGVDAAAVLRDELAARGLEVADIGGQQVDDDTAHRTVAS
jgi:hypothetical protein